MRGVCRTLIHVALPALGVLALETVAVAQSATLPMRMSVTVRSATSLRVSSQNLLVAPMAAAGTVDTTIDVDAAARTSTNGEVVLTVEALRDVSELAGGAADGAVEIEFAGSDPGVVAGVLSTEPRVAGRWAGSGLRRVRVTFTLRARGPINGGNVPLRFALSLP